MNIMLVTVTERTRTSASPRARRRPARHPDPVSIEASIPSFAGGVAGTLIGAGLPLYLFLYGVDVPVSGVSVLVASSSRWASACSSASTRRARPPR
jgi:macrolide transport system ATP-binding/permease protein